MKDLGRETLQAALTLLGDLMERRGVPFHHFVVCGGSSLIILEMVSRTATQDVDVVGVMDGDDLKTARPLDPTVIEVAGQVREELELPKDWFNTGPSDESLFRLGLPDGLVGRTTRRDFGPKLAISFIGRRDQIFFKVYAAVDQGAGRHLSDLKDLKPNQEELLAAAKWTRQHDPSDGFKMMLGELLTHLGHEQLIDQL